MATQHFGRITPLQGAVLALGGVVSGVPEDLLLQIDRIQAMQNAKEFLTKTTYVDFGFDLSAWHQYLQSEKKYKDEYTFKYAWKGVKKKIHQLITDAERLRLVALAESM